MRMVYSICVDCGKIIPESYTMPFCPPCAVIEEINKRKYAEAELQEMEGDDAR